LVNNLESYIDKENIGQNYLNAVLQAIPEIIILLDEMGNYIAILTSDSDDLVDKKENLIGRNVRDFLPDRVAKQFIACCGSSFNSKELQNFDYSLNIKGEEKYFEVYFSPLKSDDKLGSLVLASIRNITELKETEKALKEQQAYFEQLFNNSTEAIVLLDNNHHVIKVNQRFEILFGYKEEEILGCNLDNYIIPDESLEEGKEFTKAVKAGQKIKGEAVRKNRAGEKINVFLQGFPIELANGQAGIYALYNDISEKKKKEEQIKYLSFHDEMTGLYNRRYFENEMEKLNKSRKLPISIIIGDLDNLKYINDNFGHKKGDQYIMKAAELISRNFRDGDITARIGGDEFAVLLPETDYETALEMCERIKSSFGNCSKFINLDISLGSAAKNSFSEDLEEAFIEADKKMYQEKKSKY
jgi:diguanylate cyclase (GGDEF)-like protein/PAS domain S-box-containing protein